MVVVKLVFVALIAVCLLVSYLIKFFFPEEKYKNNPMKRVKIIVRVRLGCFLSSFILLFICLII